MARVGVITFLGSLDDRDAMRAVGVVGGEAVSLWHGSTDLQGVDAILLPGGFSYGDHLRCGALARFSPIMGVVAEFAAAGGPVLGICNGFQILCESHLLPGALVRNHELHFLCRDQRISIKNNETSWTRGYALNQEIVIPLKNGEGSFQCDDTVLEMLEKENRIVARYVGRNPNGSRNKIAGITNERGNIVGLMPHPEHAVEDLTGPGTDGLPFFTSLLMQAVNA